MGAGMTAPWAPSPAWMAPDGPLITATPASPPPRAPPPNPAPPPMTAMAPAPPAPPAPKPSPPFEEDIISSGFSNIYLIKEENMKRKN